MFKTVWRRTSWMLIGPTWWWKLDKERKHRHYNGKDTEKQTNERANEWKNERKNRAEIHEWNTYWVRLEQLKITRFSGTIVGCSANFYKTYRELLSIFYVKRNNTYTEKVKWKCAKTAYFQHFRPKKLFFENWTLSHFRY